MGARAVPDHKKLLAMGRMHSKGKGISRRSLPYKRTPPSWVKQSASDTIKEICNMAKKGYTPSQIGVVLRDSHGIPQVKMIRQQDRPDPPCPGHCPESAGGPVLPHQEGCCRAQAP